MRYFNKLPTISYFGQACKNLLSRVKFSEETKKNVSVFYPYTLKEEDTRADIVSFKYYDDADYAWLIYHTNDVIDPYFDLGMNQNNLDSIIISKYGSLRNSMRKIKYYRNDWASDESILDQSQYNSLSLGQKKYYNVIVGYNNQITGYTRKKEDWIVDTNKIISLNITLSSPNSQYSIGELITQYSNSNIKIAEGEITFANTSTLNVKSVTGNFIANSGSLVNDANTLASLTDTKIIFSNIPADEVTYWSPISYYQYENELNQEKKNIKLLDNRYINEIETEFSKLLND